LFLVHKAAKDRQKIDKIDVIIYRLEHSRGVLNWWNFEEPSQGRLLAARGPWHWLIHEALDTYL